MTPMELTPETKAAVVTQGLTKRFDRQGAVTNVDLTIAEGSVYGLIGPNGAGKTTLIRMLATAEEPTRGEIYLFGDRLVAGADNLRIKQYLGYLPDDYPLYEDLNVWDYLDYFARLYHLKNPSRRHRIQEVLELVQLTSKRHSRINSLSRGMKQRLSLARTIIHEPILLLLDEPVSGLDPLARQQFRDIIRVLQAAGMTILISSHVLSDLAELCTAIGVMELGCLVESTTLADLYNRLGQRTITITLLGGVEQLPDCLKDQPGVEDWQINYDQGDQQSSAPGVHCSVIFSGSPADSANLLRNLIYAGCQVSQFHCQQEDLESIFLKLGHQQVS
ncbi:ABC transporter ATP-binding protein [Synechocystis sp. FACHB-383]|uniref:ATP-binding cassette domain-containing protein n=1 Tax=Synechocystis sp. FACHB-383 TaxID=2692864 RepID=UPI001685076D|nr:ABC transporter ATP-binding protein [Synechocystis sp. FACHB-383]